MSKMFEREIKEYYSNDQMWRHYYLNVDDQLVGEFKEWYETGELCELCSFNVDGKIHGECKYWIKNGVLTSHIFYVNGVLDKRIV